MNAILISEMSDFREQYGVTTKNIIRCTRLYSQLTMRTKITILEITLNIPDSSSVTLPIQCRLALKYILNLNNYRHGDCAEHRGSIEKICINNRNL
jgi:hypothetical protein